MSFLTTAGSTQSVKLFTAEQEVVCSNYSQGWAKTQGLKI